MHIHARSSLLLPGDWGYPTNTSDTARFPYYVNAIERLAGHTPGGEGRAAKPPVDVVLVDGRFRVAAALKALWHIDAASVVIIHDWTQRVKVYGLVLQYYNIVHSVDSLVVLARKEDVDWAGATADLTRFIYSPLRRLAA